MTAARDGCRRDARLGAAARGGDPVLRHFAETIAAAPQLRASSISRPSAYTATTTARGSMRTTTAAPVSERSRERLAAEQEWAALGRRAGKPVAILRLSGIYGPGQNAFVQAESAAARNASTSRARCSTASMWPTSRRRSTRRSPASANGVFNVTDDKPTRRAYRSHSRPNCSASRRRRKSRSPKPRKGCRRWRCRFMARASACGTTALKRELGVALALSELSRRIARAVRE